MNKPRPISDQIPVDLEDMYKTIADVEFVPPPPPVTERPVIVNSMSASNTNPQLTIIADAIKRAEKLFATKNAEYGDKADILANFRRLSEQQDVPMSTVWMFLAGKHIDTIQQYVKDARNNKSRARSEPIRDRIDDLVVYSLLLLAIVAEENR